MKLCGYCILLPDYLVISVRNVQCQLLGLRGSTILLLWVYVCAARQSEHRLFTCLHSTLGMQGWGRLHPCALHTHVSLTGAVCIAFSYLGIGGGGLHPPHSLLRSFRNNFKLLWDRFLHNYPGVGLLIECAGFFTFTPYW